MKTSPSHEPITGMPASAGIARGPAFVCACGEDSVAPRRSIRAEEVPAELERLRLAETEVENDLAALQADVGRKIGDQAASILEAQAALLRDPMLHDATARRCREELVNVEAALSDTVDELARGFARVDDALIRERADDLRDVARRLLDRLQARDGSGMPQIPDGCILVTRELLPSVAATLDHQHIRGIIAEQGATTAHAVILARALGIPTLIHVDEATRRIATEDALILDGISGRVYINPSRMVQSEYNRAESDFAARRKVLQESLDLPAVTLDGTAVRLSANAGKMADASAAMAFNADGIGLYRTEFVFLVRDHFPSEEEQCEIYRKTAAYVEGRMTVIRVLDVGSDKMLPYFPLPPETNPSLGRRGMRLLLGHRKILITQLRAILRVSAERPVAVLFPMIGGVDEIIEARDALEEAKAQLRAEGTPFDANIRVGAMIETPAAAITARYIAREVDFLSIGTNDLVQYMLTTDRTSSDMAAYYEPLHPAIIQALKWIFEAAAAEGTDISLCGEIAGNPAYVELLLGLGARSLSVAPGEILEVKRVIRSSNMAEAIALAQRVLGARTVREVKAALAARVSPEI
ncbi:MAG: phosphoenolpyruvate--protein phosphotransferase [Opitutaceae bacterium]